MDVCLFYAKTLKRIFTFHFRIITYFCFYSDIMSPSDYFSDLLLGRNTSLKITLLDTIMAFFRKGSGSVLTEGWL